MNAQQTHHLRDWFIAKPSSSESILRNISVEFDVSVDELLGTDRCAAITRARQEAYLRLRELGWTLPRIGRRMKRDHTTIMHGIQRAKQRREAAQ